MGEIEALAPPRSRLVNPRLIASPEVTLHDYSESGR
jgi:hypothetical protein